MPPKEGHAPGKTAPQLQQKTFQPRQTSVKLTGRRDAQLKLRQPKYQATLTQYDNFKSTGSSFASEELGDEWKEERPAKRQRTEDTRGERQTTITQLIPSPFQEEEEDDVLLSDVDEAHVPETPKERKAIRNVKQEPLSTSPVHEDIQDVTIPSTVVPERRSKSPGVFSTPVRKYPKDEIPSSQTPNSALYTRSVLRRNFSPQRSPLQTMDMNTPVRSTAKGAKISSTSARSRRSLERRRVADSAITFRVPALPGLKLGPVSRSPGSSVRKQPRFERMTTVPDSQSGGSDESIPSLAAEQSVLASPHTSHDSTHSAMQVQASVLSSSIRKKRPLVRTRSTIPDSQFDESNESLHIDDNDDGTDAYRVPGTVMAAFPRSSQTQISNYAPSSVMGMSQYPHTYDPVYSAMERDAERYGETQRLFPGLLQGQDWDVSQNENAEAKPEADQVYDEIAVYEDPDQDQPLPPTDTIDLVSDVAEHDDQPFLSTGQYSQAAQSPVREDQTGSAQEMTPAMSPISHANSPTKSVITPRTLSSLDYNRTPSGDTDVWIYDSQKRPLRLKTVDEIAPLSALLDSPGPGPPSSPSPPLEMDYDDDDATQTPSQSRYRVWNSSPPAILSVPAGRSAHLSHDLQTDLAGLGGTDSIDFADFPVPGMSDPLADQQDSVQIVGPRGPEIDDSEDELDEDLTLVNPATPSPRGKGAQATSGHGRHDDLLPRDSILPASCNADRQPALKRTASKQPHPTPFTAFSDAGEACHKPPGPQLAPPTSSQATEPSDPLPQHEPKTAVEDAEEAADDADTTLVADEHGTSTAKIPGSPFKQNETSATPKSTRGNGKQSRVVRDLPQKPARDYSLPPPSSSWRSSGRLRMR